MMPAVSTACLYPKPTEDALYDLCLHGVQQVEIFLNAPSECRPVYANDLRAMLRHFGATCVAVHPWTAPMEGYMLFSNYSRRVADFLEETKRIFEMMQTVGATHYVLHGAYASGMAIPFYCERFSMLAETGRQFGVVVTQENVLRFESQSLRFLNEFCRQLGDTARLTLDVKQAVRAGHDPMEMVRSLGSHIAHVHFSDHGAGGDCLRIGKGRMAMLPFLETLSQAGFHGAITLELYRSGFDGVAALFEDYQKIGRLIQRIS